MVTLVLWVDVFSLRIDHRLHRGGPFTEPGHDLRRKIAVILIALVIHGASAVGFITR
jgi:hypothetical protein